MISLSSWSIRKKLLFLIFVAVLPALGIILFSGIKHREYEIASTKRDIMHLVQSLAAQQEQIAASTRQMLRTMAQLPEVQKKDAKACNRIFRNIHEQNPIYSTISAATPDGNMFAASAPFTPGSVNLADRKHIRDAIRTRDFSAGEYIVGKLSRIPSINFTYPVLDKNGKVIAILIAGLRLDKYKEFMAQVNLPKGSVMGITDHKNITLYRFPESESIPPGTPVPLQNLQEIPVDSREGFWEGIGRDNVLRIYAYKKVWLRDNEPWYLGIYVGVDKNLVLHHANTELVYNLAFLWIACLLAMLLACIAGNSIIVNPLNKLVIATQRFGKGEMHTRTDLPHGEDELGRLAKSFDTMAVMLEMGDLERRKMENALKESEKKYRQLVETLQEGIWSIDEDSNTTFVNPRMAEMLGYTVEEMLGKPIFSFMDERGVEIAKIGIDRGKQNITEQMDFELIRKDGNRVYSSLAAIPLTDEKGNYVGSLAGVSDITSRKHAEKALQESELKFRTLFEDSRDAIYITTKEGMFIDFNRAYLELFGYTEEEMINLYAKDTYMNPADRGMFKKMMEKKGSVKDYEVKLRRKDGRQMDCIIAAAIRYADDGSISGYQGIIRDITERKYLERQLHTMSLTDELTGLYNRRGFFTLAQQQMKVAERTKKDMLLFFVDLDKMKQINDTLGHQEGDKALVEVAAILKEVFRESDIMGRMGGDEFAIFVIDTSDETREVLTMRLYNTLDDYNRPEGRTYHLSLSIGIAHYNPETPSTLDELMAQADILMYEEKRGKQY